MGNVWKSITVRLDANVSGYVGKLSTAAAATKGLGQEVVSTASRLDSKSRQVTASAGKLMLGVGLASSLALGLMAKSTMGFDKAMSGVDAVTTTTASNLGKLRQAALDAGQATVFSASQAATAEAELARAGVGVNDILGGALRGSLDLAAAGQLELKDAAIITAQALNVFQLRGSQATRVADTLAAGANKSAADVHQLGEALRMGGLVARQVGLSLEDTTGTLALFADNALIGSDAGTSMKTMLQRLVPQSKEAAAMMRHLGLDFFNAKGEFIGIAEMAGMLRSKLGGLSDEQRLTALTTIFGADAIRSANILYEEGAVGVRDYIKAVTDQGAAQRMAAAQLDNLSGDLEQFKGSLETAFITGGSKATGALRGITQAATGAVNGFLELPGAAQTAVGGVAALTAVVGTAGGAFLLLAPKIKLALDLYSSLATTAPRLAGALRIGAIGLGVMGAALTAGTIALSIYGKKKAEASRVTDSFAQALKAEAEGMKGSVAATLSAELAMNRSGGLMGLGKDRGSVAGRAKDLGISIKTISAAIRGNTDDLESFVRQAREAGDSWDVLSLVGDVANLRAGFAAGTVSAKELAAAEKELGVKSQELGAGVDVSTEAMERQKEAAQAAEKRITDLAGSIRTFLGAGPALQLVDTAAADAAGAALEKQHRRQSDALSDRHQAEREAASESARIASQGGAEVNAEVGRALSQRQEMESRALADRQEAERKSVAEQKGTLAAWAEQLEKQVADANAWQANLLVVAKRFGPEVARILSSMGKEGASRVAELAGAADPIGQRVSSALRTDAQAGLDETGQVLDRGFALMGTLAAKGGETIAAQFLAKLREGKQPLADLMAEYLALVTDIVLVKPDGTVTKGFPGKVVASPTNKPGQQRGPGGILFEAEGDVIPERHEAVMARSGKIRVWNEPETGGESYIPHHPSKRNRSTAILGATANMFGYRLSSFADGGVVTAPAGVGRVAATTAWSDSAILDELRALRAAIASMPAAQIDASMHNEFKGGDVPTFAELEYLSRRQAERLSTAGRG